MFYENALSNLNITTYNAIEHQTKYFGLNCYIYFPKTTENIYNDASQDNEYGDSPDIADVFLVIGLNQLRPDTKEDFSNFNVIDIDQEVYMLTTNQDYFYIPRNSKVEVSFNDAVWTFRTLNKPVYNGLDKQHLYAKYVLIPYV